ncbi:MAG: insulinase family protein, partial [Betaproteobacteria bacterium]|nr:insulinase family protein [Betaproteobacteria bacterium]
MFKARALLFGATLMLLESAALAGLPIAHWSTSTGARVYFVESHALPMLDVSVEFAAGSSRDVASKSGAGSMTLRLMRMGAAGMDENSISEQLADVGAVLGSSFDVDRAGVSLRTLSHKQFREPALDIMSTLLARPTFPDGILARESQRVLAGLKEARMKPETLGGRALSRMVFGDHPYQLPGAGEIETLGAITRQDLVDFHT